MDILYGYYSREADKEYGFLTPFKYYDPWGNLVPITFVCDSPSAIEDEEYIWSDARCVGVVFTEPVCILTKAEDREILANLTSIDKDTRAICEVAHQIADENVGLRKTIQILIDGIVGMPEDMDDCGCDDYSCHDDEIYYYGDIYPVYPDDSYDKGYLPPICPDEDDYDYDGPSEFMNKHDFPIKKDMPSY